MNKARKERKETLRKIMRMLRPMTTQELRNVCAFVSGYSGTWKKEKNYE